jgi:hypothetical protein
VAGGAGSVQVGDARVCADLSLEGGPGQAGHAGSAPAVAVTAPGSHPDQAPHPSFVNARRSSSTGDVASLPSAAVVGAAASWLAATGTTGVLVVAVSGVALASGLYVASRRNSVTVATSTTPDVDEVDPCPAPDFAVWP